MESWKEIHLWCGVAPKPSTRGFNFDNMHKRKYALLALARLDRGCRPNNVVGAVSLKYVVSPMPIDLLSDMKTFAYRLFTLPAITYAT